MENIGNSLFLLLEQKAVFLPLLLIVLEELGLPIPFTDFVTTYIGYQIYKGNLTFFEAYALVLSANLLGPTILYFIAKEHGHKFIKTYGRFIHLDETKLESLRKRFKKYGFLFIIIGRHLPGLKAPTTVFSGVSKISYKVFIISIFFSVVFWIPFYLSLGQRLGPKTVVYFHDHIVYASIIMVIGIVIILFPLLYSFIKRKK